MAGGRLCGLLAASCLFALCSATTNVYYLVVEDVSTGAIVDYPVSLATFSSDPVDDSAHPMTAPNPGNENGCDALTSGRHVGTIVLVLRGGCTFVEKAANAASAGAKAVVITNINATFPVVMSGDPPEGWNPIVVSSLGGGDGQAVSELLSRSGDVQGRFREGQRGYTAMIALWFMAVGTVVTGSLWASPKVGQRMPSPTQPQDPDNPTVFIGEWAAMGFVVMASLVLVVLFFFMKKLILAIIILFCIGSISAMYKCWYDLITAVVPFRKDTCCTRTVFVPCFGDCDMLSLAITACAITVAALFLVYRKEEFSWVLQDVMGISMCLLFIKTFRFPNIKVSCLLLVLAFLYDIFWVFVSPLLFQGKSVMVHVATGGGSGEAIPMLLKFPNSCYKCGPGMLGLGDIVLPGLFVSFTRAFDRSRALPPMRGYFLYNVIGYGVGLLLTYVALMLMEKGQPALLYLVPCTLGPTVLLAMARGDLRSLWRGPGSSGSDDSKLPTGGMLLNDTVGSSNDTP